MTTYADRFWQKVDKSGECWTWTGAKGPGGYGKVHIRALRASPIDTHRAVYFIVTAS